MIQGRQWKDAFTSILGSQALSKVRSSNMYAGKHPSESECPNVGDLSGHRVPDNFTAHRINLPENDGSRVSDLAGLPWCTGIIFAGFQSVGDTAPFKNQAGTIRVRGSRRL